MESGNRLEFLLEKYVNGVCSGEELDEFFLLILSGTNDKTLAKKIDDHFANNEFAGQPDIPPHIAQEIIHNILSSEAKVAQLNDRVKKPRMLVKWMVAAGVACLLIIAYFFTVKGDSHNEFAQLIPKNDITQNNNTATYSQIRLGDGTVVKLAPKSTIYYSKAFGENSRKVYLDGDAIFDVAHDANKPFLVYSNNIVTKVLGTKFEIHSNQKNGEIEVAVTSGKVQVIENEKLVQKQGEHEEKAVIITPNQRAIYSSQTRQFVCKLIEKPVPLVNNASNEHSEDTLLLGSKPSKPKTLSFIYEQTELSNVFEDIQNVYGVDIEVENSGIKNCVFTGDINNKDLFVMLKIICLSTGSDYEVLGTKILIKGKGCPSDLNG